MIRAAHPTLLRSGYGGGASAGNAYCLAETRRVCWDDAAPESITVGLAADHEIVRNGHPDEHARDARLEILPRIAAAYMNPEIAERLVLSVRTVAPSAFAPQCGLSGGSSPSAVTT